MVAGNGFDNELCRVGLEFLCECFLLSLWGTRYVGGGEALVGGHDGSASQWSLAMALTTNSVVWDLSFRVNVFFLHAAKGALRMFSHSLAPQDVCFMNASTEE